MQKTPVTPKKQRESEKARSGDKSRNPVPQIREAGALTSAGIEQGHSQSDIPKSRRKNFASFGSE
ncbi:MAG: hypothetical protein IAG10_09295 [Planctomycetaceae bacterium]|nr:hypothetical protein [Planctomycetaceae bacterium]